MKMNKTNGRVCCAPWYMPRRSLWLGVVLIVVLQGSALATVPEWTDSRSLEELKAAAEQGDAAAMAVIGWRYHNGVGVDADRDAARQWWQRGADEGNARAITRLAWTLRFERYAEMVALLRRAAEQGDALAMHFLGMSHYMGWGVDGPNEISARIWAERAAEAGSITAMRRLAWWAQEGILADPHRARQWAQRAVDEATREQPPLEIEDMQALSGMYLMGHGVDPDVQKAREWARRATEAGDVTAAYVLAVYQARTAEPDPAELASSITLGAKKQDPEAIRLLAALHLDGIGVPRDSDRGMELMHRAAELGSSEAMRLLSTRYKDGASGVERNDELALEWLQKAAEAGNTNAMIMLAHRYDQGIGVPRSDERMTHWLFQAARLGDAKAMNLIGTLIIKDPEWDKIVGLHWLLMAADRGDAEAMYSVGVFFEEHHPPLRQDGHTLKWLLRAAEAGHVDAMRVVGHRLSTATGVEQDADRGLEWTRRAVERGNAIAMMNLGLLYFEGVGVERDDAQAVYWWLRAAEAGESYAEYCLGIAYDRGRGVEADPQRAAHWMRRAAAAGNSEALRWLEQRAR